MSVRSNVQITQYPGEVNEFMAPYDASVSIAKGDLLALVSDKAVVLTTAQIANFLGVAAASNNDGAEAGKIRVLRKCQVRIPMHAAIDIGDDVTFDTTSNSTGANGTDWKLEEAGTKIGTMLETLSAAGTGEVLLESLAI